MGRKHTNWLIYMNGSASNGQAKHNTNVVLQLDQLETVDFMFNSHALMKYI